MSKKLNILLVTILLTSTTTFAAANFNYTQNTPAPLYQPNYYQQNNYNFNNNTLKGSVV